MGRGCKRREALSRPVPIVRGLDPSIRTHPIPPQLPPTPPQRGILKTQNTRIPRAHSGVEPPVPIPNTEVKRASADGTGRATAWESRSVRGIFPFAGVAQSVEHDLAKVGVAGSSPVSRSNTQTPQVKTWGVYPFRSSSLSQSAHTSRWADRKSTRLNSSHTDIFRMPSSA